MVQQKCLEFENKIYEYIKKHIIPIGFIIITILAIGARFYFLRYQTWDYTGFLSKWIEQIEANGGFFALKDKIGDYNCIYMTILAALTYIPISPLYTIKAISILFDFILAFSSYKLVNKFLREKERKGIIGLITYGLILFAPTVLLNGACWGQCDSIYATFVIISLIFLIDEKYFWSFTFLGLAFAFKLQFIFILPLYILVWISKRKFPVYYFGILPVVNFITCIPSIAFGKPIKDCLLVYVNQMGSYSQFTSNNFPSIYNLFCQLTEKSEALAIESIDVAKVGIIITLALYVIMACIIIYKKVNISKELIIYIGLWSVVVATFFMPNMHDRYMFVADVISILAVIIFRTKSSIFYAVVINLNSFATYTRYLFGTEFVNIQIATILQLIVVIALTYDLLKNKGIMSQSDENIDILDKK